MELPSHIESLIVIVLIAIVLALVAARWLLPRVLKLKQKTVTATPIPALPNRRIVEQQPVAAVIESDITHAREDGRCECGAVAVLPMPVTVASFSHFDDEPPKRNWRHYFAWLGNDDEEEQQQESAPKPQEDTRRFRLEGQVEAYDVTWPEHVPIELCALCAAAADELLRQKHDEIRRGNQEHAAKTRRQLFVLTRGGLRKLLQQELARADRDVERING